MGYLTFNSKLQIMLWLFNSPKRKKKRKKLYAKSKE